LFVPTPANHAVRLTWSQVEGATGYRIKFGTEKGAYASTVDAGLLNGYTITTLTNGRQYFFIVEAYNSTGNSVASNEQTAQPGEPRCVGSTFPQSAPRPPAVLCGIFVLRRVAIVNVYEGANAVKTFRR
jgi:hypothetical protein